MFKTRAAVFFYRDFIPRGAPTGFRPDKTRAASFLNGFKNIPGKACVKRVHNNDAFVNVGNQHTKKNIKHRILTRRRFLSDIKLLHVMFYGPFDRSMGLHMYDLLMNF